MYKSTLIRRSPLPLTWFTLALAGTFLGSSCSNDSRGPVPECVCAAPLNVTVTLEGGGFDELLSLQVSLEEVRLLGVSESSNGVDGVNLLRETDSVEVLGLDRRALSLGTGFYATEALDRVRVTLSRTAPVARDLAGAIVEVSSPVQRTFTLPLPAPILLPSSPVRSELVVLELDVAASLSQSGVGDSLVFDPVFRANVLTGGQSIRMETVFGGVSGQNLDGSVSIYGAQGSLHDHLGANVIARFTQDTAFYDESALELIDQDEFKLRLQGGQKYVSASGSWQPASTNLFGVDMAVTSIRITGVSDSPSEMLPALVEGRVVGAGAPGEIQLRVVEIDGNEGIFGTLASQPDPETLSIVPSLDALIYDEDGTALTVAQLTAGARLRVTIQPRAVTSAPFATSTIVQLEAPEHRGMLMDDGGETALFLANGEAAIESGAVQSSLTPITLQLSGTAPVLDVIGRPSVAFSDLLPPLQVAASGTLVGDPSAPDLTNASLVIRPGRLDGFVSAINAVDETFDASVETIHVPFGGSATSPPFQFVLAPGCVFEGSATTRAAFFALFDALEPGESLAITVAGLGTPAANEVAAYEVRSSVD